MKPYKCEGIILLQRQLKEADKLIVVWTSNEGKKAFVVKGANKILGKKVTALDTLNQISFSALASKSEQQLLIEASIINDFSELKKHYDAVAAVMYMLELLDKFLTSEQSSHAFYNLFSNILEQLNANPGNFNIFIVYFQMQLLLNTGFAPSLQNCCYCYDDLQPNQERIANDTNEPGYICQKHLDNIDKHLVYVSDTIIKIQKYLSSCDALGVLNIKIKTTNLIELFNIQNTWIEAILERSLNSKSLLKIWTKQEKST